jgi:pimeloyl-ACP methyl ester carboxylesterase
MDVLGIDRCVLGAESAGAKTALAAALAAPARFEGLVLVDGNHAPGRPAGDNPFAAALRADFAAALDGFMASCTPGENRAHIRRWGYDILARARPEPAARLAELGAGFDLGDRLGEIVIPTLLIHSERDRIVPLSLSQDLAARLPNSKLVVIDSDSHVPTMTEADQVVAAIMEFFG